ncbi:MAG: hypothetical protein ACREE7_13275 [Dongiaceae bacterium]
MPRSPTRRQRFLVLALSATLLGIPLQAAEPAFIAGVEDLPLMPGLREIDSAATVFDSAGGRIVEAYATGEVTEPAVTAFYGEMLPQLGWTAARPTFFSRSGETLRLDYLHYGKGLTVRFTLSPE